MLVHPREEIAERKLGIRPANGFEQADIAFEASAERRLIEVAIVHEQPVGPRKAAGEGLGFGLVIALVGTAHFAEEDVRAKIRPVGQAIGEDLRATRRGILDHHGRGMVARIPAKSPAM